MISIIIPTFNRASTLKESIYSLTEQTLQDIEIIVVDDCSSDNTKDVVSAFSDARIKYIKLGKKSGANAARNIGIEASSGEFISFHDSDDIARTNKIESLLDCLTKNNADVAFGMIERQGYPKEYKKIYPELKPGLVKREKLISNSYVSAQSLIAKREVVEKIRFDEELRMWQDFDWVIRASMEYVFSFVETVVETVILQSDSISRSGNKALVEINETLLNKYCKNYGEYVQLERFLLSNLISLKCLLGEDCLSECQRIKKIKHSFSDSIKVMMYETGTLRGYYSLRNYVRSNGVYLKKI